MAKRKKDLTQEERLRALEELHTEDLARFALLMNVGGKQRWARCLGECHVTRRVLVRYTDNGEVALLDPAAWNQARRMAGA